VRAVLIDPEGGRISFSFSSSRDLRLPGIERVPVVRWSTAPNDPSAIELRWESVSCVGCQLQAYEILEVANSLPSAALANTQLRERQTVYLVDTDGLPAVQAPLDARQHARALRRNQVVPGDAIDHAPPKIQLCRHYSEDSFEHAVLRCLPGLRMKFCIRVIVLPTSANLGIEIVSDCEYFEPPPQLTCPAGRIWRLFSSEYGSSLPAVIGTSGRSPVIHIMDQGSRIRLEVAGNPRGDDRVSVAAALTGQFMERPVDWGATAVAPGAVGKAELKHGSSSVRLKPGELDVLVGLIVDVEPIVGGFVVIHETLGDDTFLEWVLVNPALAADRERVGGGIAYFSNLLITSRHMIERAPWGVMREVFTGGPWGQASRLQGRQTRISPE